MIFSENVYLTKYIIDIQIHKIRAFPISSCYSQIETPLTDRDRCVGIHGKKVAGRSNPTWVHESRSHHHVTTDVREGEGGVLSVSVQQYLAALPVSPRTPRAPSAAETTDSRLL